MPLSVALILAGVLASQDPAALPASWEMAFDDLGPGDSTPRSTEGWGPSGPPLTLFHAQALAVRADDFDGDGDYDIVLGGNSADRVRIHYLEYSSITRTWDVERVEDMQDDTRTCYDLDVGDVNGDGFCDLLVARRAGALTDADQDALFLNTGQDDGNGNWFGDALLVPNPTPGIRETFSARLHDVTGDGFLDVVSTGEYGLRVYSWDPAADQLVFRFQASDPEDALDPDLEIIYRQLAIGDIDGDGDADLVIPRGHPARTKAWFNQRIDPDPGVDPAVTLFVLTDQPGLSIPTDLAVTWMLSDGCPGPAGVKICQSDTFEVALGDVDGDGDLDLFSANNFASNCLHLNDGLGRFGSDDDSPTTSDDGQPAWIFPSPTPDYVGPSTILDIVNGNDSFLYDGNTPVDGFGFTCCAPPSPPLAPGCAWHYTFPGALLDRTTGVSLHDLDDDGQVDWIAFSNRNDWEEFYRLTWAKRLIYPLAQQVFPQIAGVISPAEWLDRFVYLTNDPINFPVPPVYDHLYTNATSTAPGAGLAFDERVELLGEPNDGTSYGEFVQMNDEFGAYHADNAPDWLDANWANLFQGQRNRVLWGHPLRARGADQVGELTAGSDVIPFNLHLSLTEDIALGVDPDEVLQWVIVPSGLDMYPDPAADVWGVAPFDVPVWPDPFQSLAWAFFPQSGLTGVIDLPSPVSGQPYEIDIQVALPRILFEFTGVQDDVFMSALVYGRDGTDFTLYWSSNPLRMPLTEPGVPAAPIVP